MAQVLISKEKRVIIFKGKTKVLPGRNIISDELAEEMKANKWFSSFLVREKMAFEVVKKQDSSSKQDTEPITDLQLILDMSAREAVKFVGDSADIALLREVVEYSEKSKVVKAATKQIEKLEEGREADGEE